MLKIGVTRGVPHTQRLLLPTEELSKSVELRCFWTVYDF